MKIFFEEYKYPRSAVKPYLHVYDINLAEKKQLFTPPTLQSIEDDHDVWNLICNYLRNKPNTSQLQLQKELMDMFGKKYWGMAKKDWYDIIKEYFILPPVIDRPTVLDNEDYSKAAENSLNK